MTDNFNFTDHNINLKQTPERTLGIATYELGKVIENVIKADVYGTPQVYLGDAKSEAADLISMVRLFCEQMGWDFNELQTLGEERYLARMTDIRKYSTQELLKKRGDE